MVQATSRRKLLNVPFHWLNVTHVVQPDVAMRGMDMQVALPDLMQSNADQNIARIEQRRDVKSLPHAVVLRSGEPWQIVSEVMSEKNIDLIVMGTRGLGGISKLFLGSTAEKAMRHASCPVLTVGSGLLIFDRVQAIRCSGSRCTAGAELRILQRSDRSVSSGEQWGSRRLT